MTQLKEGGCQPRDREERSFFRVDCHREVAGNGWDEPCKSRGLRTVLWAAGGEIPPAESRAGRSPLGSNARAIAFLTSGRVWRYRQNLHLLRPTAIRCGAARATGDYCARKCARSMEKRRARSDRQAAAGAKMDSSPSTGTIPTARRNSVPTGRATLTAPGRAWPEAVTSSARGNV